jgi:CspA family cold shock protein
MALGTIKKLTDRGFGFITTDNGELFFHMSAVQDTTYDQLREGQSVEYTEGQGPKGPRADTVRPV